MITKNTKLKGAFFVELEKLGDDRGFFSRTWCQQEFRQAGLNSNMAQISISFSKKKGTLRGLHFQLPPFEETKLVRCIKGAVYDVIIDLRPNSPTFKQWEASELTEKNYKMVYVPQGFAHGVQTLEDNTEVLYLNSQFHSPDFERGVRWNDPSFKVEWPLQITNITQRDQSHKDFKLNTQEQNF